MKMVEVHSCCQNFKISHCSESLCSNFPESADGFCKKEAQQLRNRNSYLENQLKDLSHKLEGYAVLLYRRKIIMRFVEWNMLLISN